ncbi:sugar diacid recognition domain-containing protein [Serratia marcescens]|uniref:sugar diacid recognition domain-containing protein n=1 Tax=Serratia marcescens TaxID=615 RepID=UPI0004E30A1C|nr:sugar diacid recognition domain-containing protein [Serratia marcescens]KFD10494.1 sugar diacid utilization regulator [Serratia marcescens subsp. marcescens ATCC 13880]KFL04987.1 carbohydrate diacid regulator [Serratia marcescens]MCC3249841.1 helix-turn-helix domain-containing protein [Serratia marcescens]PNU44607.1 XRE family transcriptional regulator [Serratia marcescens subsp. marcescens ATCC 13880]QDL84865.1 XRE family transcriptional regulator [Serratia marcescens subsp. marcescens ATC
MLRQTNLLAEATARQIVQRAMGIISHSVNVMDSNGVIIASGNPQRLFQRHEGAVLALAENRVVEIDRATAEHLKGVRPGINLPFSFRNQRVGVIGISGEPAEVRAYAELVKMAAEMMVEQAALLDQHQWEKRYREELANQLLQPQPNTASLEAMAAYLGLDLRQARIVWIVELQEAQPHLLRELLAELEATQRDALIAITGFNEMTLLRPACMAQGEWSLKLERQQAQRLQNQLKHRFRVRLIVGGFYDDPQSAYRSSLTARATQAMAQRLKLRHATLFYHDYPLPSLLCDLGEDWRAQELGRPWRTLGEQDEKGVLRSTLRHYFSQNCDQTQTAAQLHIHVNTLRYRLQRIEAITGVKINQLTDSLRLFIGMLMHD